MKNLAIKLIAFLLISIFLTGCSYRKFEDSIRDLINNESSVSSTEHAPILDDDIEILKIGDTHEVYVRAFEGSTLIEKGTKGLYITVDSVEIFNSFYDSGVEFNTSILEVDGTLNEFTEKICEENAFILVSITASYVSNEGDEVLVNATGDMSANYLPNKCSDGFLSLPTSEEILKDRSLLDTIDKSLYMEPVEVWFSDPPSGEDERLHPYRNAFSFYLKDGESFSFQLGIFAGHDFVENKNVYLSINRLSLIEYPENYKCQYFELIP